MSFAENKIPLLVLPIFDFPVLELWARLYVGIVHKKILRSLLILGHQGPVRHAERNNFLRSKQ